MKKTCISAIVCITMAIPATIEAQETLLQKSMKGYTGYGWHCGGDESISWGTELAATASSGKYAPFWLTSNRNGTVPFEPYSGGFSAYVTKQRTCPDRWIDYGFGLELNGSVASGGREYFTARQMYASARLLVFDIKAGICPDRYGYYRQDNRELSSGGLLFSDNARPMPKIFVGIEDYIPIPLLFGYAEIKGGISHAWMENNPAVKNVYIHHKYAGLRFGGDLPVNISYEFHHVAQWGGVSAKLGDLGSTFRDFVNVILMRGGGTTANEQLNKQGNHIGSQVLGIDVKSGGWKLSGYWQTIFEDGPIGFMWTAPNAEDGLWGLDLTTPWPYISGAVLEFLHTKNQSGAFHDRDGVVYGGADSYFVNSIYTNGWNYFYRTVGTPFITSPFYTEGATQTSNNRVTVWHGGIKGDIFGYRYRLLASVAQNFGTYWNPVESRNTAVMLEVKKLFPKVWGLEFGITAALDSGTQFGNSFGMMFTIAKRGLVARWR